MIFIFGDSHANFCTKDLQKHLKDPVINLHENSITMFRIGRDNIIPRFNKSFNNKNNTFIFFYGEIDCRCHIYKQINNNNRVLDEIISELTTNFITTIKNNITNYNKIIISSIAPSIRKHEYEDVHGPVTHEFPFMGTDEERSMYTMLMNKSLKELSDSNNFIFLDFFDHYARPDNTLKYELSDGICHIKENEYILKMIMDLVDKKKKDPENAKILIKGPLEWSHVPINLINDYTMSNEIPVYHWYLDHRDDNSNSNIVWTQTYVESFIDRFTENNIKNNLHGQEPYNNASLWILTALLKHSKVSSKVAVIGSITPWIEAICINVGFTDITTVEYNVPTETKYIKTISYDDFVKSNNLYDLIISYSSIEHSGLGRYGDNLNPNGDLETMSHIYDKLENDGILLLGVPVGQDCLTWNAHRVYGHKRLSLLTKNFTEIDWICTEVSRDFLNEARPSNNGPQPVIVCKKN